MNYLVIDLEMCKVPKLYQSKNYEYATEIIQVGAVLLDENFEVIGELNQYVRPRYGMIDDFISHLTGIKNSQIKNAPELKDVLKYMVDWLGDREYIVYAWSENDYSQLTHEISSKKIEDEKIKNFMDQNIWVDYQATFGKRYDFQTAVSLEDAIRYCNIHADGRLHDALDDAFNTAKLIKILEQNSDFEITLFEDEITTDSEPLNFSLGDLFAGLNLNLS